MSYNSENRIRKAIDDLLFELVKVDSNQGTDSTPDEIWLADNEKKVIIKKIRDLDEDYFQAVFNLDKTEEE